MDDEDYGAPREGSIPSGPRGVERTPGGRSEVPPQPVAPKGPTEPRPVFGAEAGGSVEAPRSETTVKAPAPTARETGVYPTALGTSGGPGSSKLPEEGCPPSKVCIGFLIFLLIFCFSLSSDLRYPFISWKHKAASVALAPLKAVKRGAQSTPGSARPKSPPPLSREEGELPHDEGEQGTGRKMSDPPMKEAGTLRPQEPQETVLALGAIPPSGDASQGAMIIRYWRAEPRRHLAWWPL